MLGFLLGLAVDNGDAVRINLGTLSKDYTEELDQLREELGSEPTEAELDAGKIKFERVWEEVSKEIGVESEGRMLSIDKETRSVEEVVIVDEKFKHIMQDMGMGEGIRFDKSLSEDNN